MFIASLLPATVRSNSDFFLCFSFGNTTNSPSTNPTETAPTGPLNGISEVPSAILAPIVDRQSGWLSSSIDRTVAITCTSL